MRKRRPENRGLPTRWTFYHGAYYYRVPPGLESHWDGKTIYRLGKTLSEAHRAYAARVEPLPGDINTLGKLFDRYALEEVPKKAPSTQESNVGALKRLKAVFGDMAPEDFEPVHAYGYRDRPGKQTPTAATRVSEL